MFLCRWTAKYSFPILTTTKLSSLLAWEYPSDAGDLVESPRAIECQNVASIFSQYNNNFIIIKAILKTVFLKFDLEIIKGRCFDYKSTAEIFSQHVNWCTKIVFLDRTVCSQIASRSPYVRTYILIYILHVNITTAINLEFVPNFSWETVLDITHTAYLTLVLLSIIFS